MSPFLRLMKVSTCASSSYRRFLSLSNLSRVFGHLLILPLVVSVMSTSARFCLSVGFCSSSSSSGANYLAVYYEKINRELKRILIYECRCNERLKAKAEGSTRLAYTGLHGELEHLKIETGWCITGAEVKSSPCASACNTALTSPVQGSARGHVPCFVAALSPISHFP